MKIIYTGLKDDTLKIIQDDDSLSAAAFKPVEEEEILSGWKNYDNTELLLIGENTKNPIQITQKVYGEDSSLSILIINDSKNFQKIKQSLLFTPFIGPTVQAVSNTAGSGLVDVVNDHIKRTNQRRSYKKFQQSVSGNVLPIKGKVERVKDEYLNRAMNEAPVGLVLINKTGHILSFNRYVETIFGKSERETLGTSFINLFDEEARESISVFFKAEGNNSAKKIVEFKKGKRVFFLEIVLSKVDKDDTAFKLILINEITDKILAQRSIEENARKVQMIIESIPDMAWTAHADGSIDFFNKRWYEYTGQKSHEAIGEGWINVVHPDDVETCDVQWKAAVEHGLDYQVECRYLNAKDNSFKWHITRALPVRNHQGEITQWVGTCTEIQGLKNTQRALQFTAEELAANNEELTAANEEITASMEEINETNDRLTKVNADLDNFIYTASHDLKAPILNIEGLIKILGQKLQKESFDREKVSWMLKMIETSILRFKGTIADLTEIVKLQRLAELETTETNLTDIVDEVCLDLQQQIAEADVQIINKLDKELAISFSRKNLKSIIYNLLSNAIKYRAPGRRPLVELDASDEGAFLVLSVKDNGLGIEQNKKDKIFGMFQRMHSHVEGTGIGLYIVRKIIENAGGNISVESQPDGGTTFYVYFPTKP